MGGQSLEGGREAEEPYCAGLHAGHHADGPEDCLFVNRRHTQPTARKVPRSCGSVAFYRLVWRTSKLTLLGPNEWSWTI